MKYITVKQLKRSLEISEQIGIMMIEKKEIWQRLVKSENLQDGIVKYSFDNGGGDTALIYFKSDTAFIKGFDHENQYNQIANYDEIESPKFYEKVYKNAPSEFFGLLDEEEIEETTFALWNIDGSDNWKSNQMESDDGGFDYLFDRYSNLDELYDILSYYYEIDITLIDELSKKTTITKEDIFILNPDRDVTEALEELSTLGVPKLPT